MNGVRFLHMALNDGTYGIRYTFDRRGQGLPMHAHDREVMEHSVEVLKGAAEIYRPDRIDARVLTPLDGLCSFDSKRDHEIMALEDGTVLLNRFNCGMPPEYSCLPPEELAGFAQLAPMTYPLEGR
jgi:hypothetical protein